MSGSSPEVVVLQAVRLAGLADRDALLDRALIREDTLAAILVRAEQDGWIEPLSFADLRGFTVTETGQARLATLLATDVADAASTEALTSALAAFEPVNARFLRVVSTWQLRSSSGDEHGYTGADTGAVEELLARLTDLGADLRTALSGAITALPRFGRYPAQYDAAVAKARVDGLRWVTGVGILSCHVVWAELHQDLLSSLGRDRTDPAGTNAGASP